MRILLSFVVTVFIFTSCTTVYFEHPQPKGDAALNAFPESFQGTYFIKDGVHIDTLFVSADKFTYPETFKKKLSKASLDTINSIRISDGLLYDDALPLDNGIPYTEANDSIHYDITIKLSKYLSDTLVIKQFGRLLILNEKEEKSEYWNSFMIKKIKNGDLQVSAVGNFKTEDSDNQKGKYDGELKDFYSITPFTKLSEETYSIDPNKKAFEQLVKKGFFKKVEIYERVR